MELGSEYPAWSEPAYASGSGVGTAADDRADVRHLLAPLDGEGGGREASFAAAYGDLRRLAHTHRARWNGNDTVSTTALVHEAYLKLARSLARFQSRAHFFATASRAMRQVLVSYAVARRTRKRGGDHRLLPLEAAEALPISDADAEQIIALNDALDRLARYDERCARVVECRFFAGLTAEETAEALGVSPKTVNRSWRAARVWLYDELHPDAARPALGVAPAEGA